MVNFGSAGRLDTSRLPLSRERSRIELFTLQRLKIPESLHRHPATMNLMESSICPKGFHRKYLEYQSRPGDSADETADKRTLDNRVEVGLRLSGLFCMGSAAAVGPTTY